MLEGEGNDRMSDGCRGLTEREASCERGPGGLHVDEHARETPRLGVHETGLNLGAGSGWPWLSGPERCPPTPFRPVSPPAASGAVQRSRRFIEKIPESQQHAADSCRRRGAAKISLSTAGPFNKRAASLCDWNPASSARLFRPCASLPTCVLLPRSPGPLSIGCRLFAVRPDRLLCVIGSVVHSAIAAAFLHSHLSSRLHKTFNKSAVSQTGDSTFWAVQWHLLRWPLGPRR
ncbi:hypothetical protein K491DRAFT_198959 [Lophiostoma macrostomum CBS 122681]|uniref:Uncharacterized protein n=1 Tax=Lophiostoma macrostomum CBS 122681 TaxID=1314788 RepID=A0A6A6SSF9_9PLEO|nr:hypothetical protein K491DRAFT_198959 [Lophiostoma macrostomum CBS 122681]